MPKKNSTTSFVVSTLNAIPRLPNAHKISQFEALLESDKNRLYAYILAFVGDPYAADDIFQETCLTLWQEFERFERGTSFAKWANVIAYYRVEKNRRKNKRYQLGLSDDFLKEFNHTTSIIESDVESLEQKWQHLEYCRSLLSPPLRKVYQSFYVDNLTAQQIANNSGRSLHAIRKAVHKLRTYLLDCVNKKVHEASP